MHYIVDCLNGDRKAAESIMKTLRENPAIEGSCYLPLNASITAHLYLSDGSLPHSVYEMFSTFIQHFLSRYLCEKLQQEARLRLLEDLPPELQGPFIKMCELLSLDRNEIHEEGASYISQMLNGSKLVKSLWLGRNPIGDNGLQKIFDSLKQNSSLKCLSISYCAMTDVGVTSLATALGNSALKRLYIHGNNEITHDGVQVLVDVLSKSAS